MPQSASQKEPFCFTGFGNANDHLALNKTCAGNSKDRCIFPREVTVEKRRHWSAVFLVPQQAEFFYPLLLRHSLWETGKTHCYLNLLLFHRYTRRWQDLSESTYVRHEVLHHHHVCRGGGHYSQRATSTTGYRHENETLPLIGIFCLVTLSQGCKLANILGYVKVKPLRGSYCERCHIFLRFRRLR